MKTFQTVFLIAMVGWAIHSRAQTSPNAHPASGDAHPAASDAHPAKDDAHPAAPSEIHPAFPGYTPDIDPSVPLGGISAPQPFTTNSINPTTETPTGPAGGAPATGAAAGTATPTPSTTTSHAETPTNTEAPTDTSSPAPATETAPATSAEPAPAPQPEPATQEHFSVPRYVPTP